MAGADEDHHEPAVSGYRIDDLVIDIGAHRVLRGEQEIPLPPLSFAFLLALTRAAPNVLSAEQAMQQVWPGLVVGPETVSQRVKLVRAALGDDSQAPRYIAGVRGRGYRMLASVTPLSPPAPPEPVAQEPAAAADPGSGEVSDVGVPQVPPRPPRWRIIVPVCIMIVLAAGLAGLAQWRGWLGSGAVAARNTVAASESIKTIAVLPLIDISPEGGNEYLGDGIAEELTDRLTKIPGLHVAARTSAFAFKGRHADVREIADALAVRHVLEGSVRREGDRLRVTAQLIDAQSGYHIWSQSYDRTWRDLLDIQDDLARSIVEGLQLVLSSDVARRLEQAPTTNLEAFDRYLSGLSKLRQPGNAEQLEEAERVFAAALAVDPGFARAHAGLCETYVMRYRQTRDTAVAVRAEEACNEALRLDSSLREVDLALANLYLISGRAEQATAIFRRAILRNPADANAHIGLARAYEGQGLVNEAEAAYRRAVETDPSYWNAQTALGNFLFNHGRADEAVTHYRRVTAAAPANAKAFNNLGAALQMTGEFEAASRAFERSLELEPTRSAYSNSGTAYYFLGRFVDAVNRYQRATEMADADHRVWGNLADALYQIEDRRAEASRAYHRSILLARRSLKINPRDGLTWAQLAFYCARVGEKAQAKQAAATALELASDTVYVHYYVALSELEQGNAAAAFTSLRHALDMGYPLKLVRAAPELARLRADERFQNLVASTDGRPPDG